MPPQIFFRSILLLVWTVTAVPADVLLAMSGPAVLSQAVSAAKQVHVSMKATTVPVGSTFRMPVFLATAPNVKLRALSLQVSYPKGTLSFAQAEKGFLLQSGAFEVEGTTSSPARDGRLETVKIQVKAPPADAASVLPAGLIVYLNFSVPKNVQPDVITLQNEVVAAERNNGTRLSTPNWSADDETVTIVGAEVAPLSPCFFYMH